MRFPSIKAVAAEIRAVNAEADGECEVRLQVYPSGRWIIRTGDPSYDLDHHGYWGASSVPGRGHRFNARDLARDLLEQAKEQKATEQ